MYPKLINMKKLNIFVLSVIAFICLSFWVFKDMETDMEVTGTLFTILLTISFLIALFLYYPFKKITIRKVCGIKK